MIGETLKTNYELVYAAAAEVLKTLDAEAAKEYRRKLRQAQHELKVFVEEHNDVLHRDYSREKYYGGGLTEKEKDDIIIKEIRTSYSKKDFTESVKKALEVLKKYGR